MAVLFLILLSFTFSLYTVSAYPLRAPEAACLHMFPKHGPEQQQSESPFAVAVSSTTYNTANITLTISSGAGRTFKGIEVRARRVTGDTEQILGTFFTNTGETFVSPVNCLGGMANVITHTSSAPKTDLTFIWQPPAISVGDVLFTATFVENFTYFWTDVRSDTLTNPSASPDRGSLGQTANTDPQINLGACGQTKGCFLIPPSCSGSACTAAISYKAVDNTVRFEMFGKAEGWISLGLSEDKMMGMDETVTCTAQGSRVTVQRGFNPQRYNERQYTVGLTDMATIQRDGSIYCAFTRPLVTSVSSGIWAITNNTVTRTPISRTYNISQEFYMFLGWGKTFKDSDVMNKHTDIPAITQNKVNFLAFRDEKPSHGSIVTGWILNTCFSVLLPLLWSGVVA